MDDPFRQKARELVMQLVGQWTAHGKHINEGFSLNALPVLSLRGKWIFQNAKQARTRWCITYEVQVRGTSTQNVSPNRIKSKRPRKYAFVDLPFFSLFSLFFFFYANCEHHHFFKRLPGRSMRIDGDCRLSGELFRSRERRFPYIFYETIRISIREREFYDSLKNHSYGSHAEINFPTLLIYEEIIFIARKYKHKCSFNTWLIIIALTQNS